MSKLLTLILLLSQPFTALPVTYNLEDLRALSQEGSYREFLNHALDVRPSQRQGEWKSMVIEMAHLYTKDLLAQKIIEKKDFDKIENIYSWPALKTDELFVARRHEIGLKYLKDCLTEKACWEEVKNFWEKDKSNPETAYQLAEITKPFTKFPLSQWDFLGHAVKSTLSEFYCKKEFVQKEIWKQLEEIYVKLTPKGDLLQQIDALLHPACLAPVNEMTEKKLYSPDKSSDRELAFEILKAQFKATTKIEDIFYTIYLLEKPSQGELFNYAWNRVKLLSQLPTRRDAVIEAFKKLDPIPDEIFSSLDDLKVRAIFKHINDNFPELISYYFNQCKAYYSGTKTFPNGNPTLHCKAFVESPRGKALLDPLLLNEFKAIFKF